MICFNYWASATKTTLTLYADDICLVAAGSSTTELKTKIKDLKAISN